MYSVILVEFDRALRKSIIDSVNWESVGFSLTGEAGNGRDALRIVRIQHPDAVILNAYLPEMDGPGFAAVLRKSCPSLKVVFFTLSGDPVAPKLGADDSLVIPFSQEGLLEQLSLLAGQLDKERHWDHGHGLPVTTRDESLLMQKNSFLSALVTEELSVACIPHKMRHYRIRLSAEAFLLMSIHIDRSSVLGAHADHLEQLRHAVRNIALKSGEKCAGAECFVHDESVVLLLADTAAAISERKRTIAAEILHKVRGYGGFTVTIGVSGLFSSLSNAKTAYIDSLKMLHLRLLEGLNRAYFPEDCEGSIYRCLPTEIQSAQFLYMLQDGQKENISLFISALFAELKEAKATLNSYQACFLKLTVLLMDAAKNCDEETIDTGEHVRYIAALHKQDSVDKITGWLEAACCELAGRLGARRRKRSVLITEYIWNCIRTDYGNSNISLKLLGEELCLDPHYLGNVFRRVTGDTFHQALNRVRMEKAYELLRTTDRSIREIAAATGFSEPHYFSACFKKYYNMLPGKLRGMQNGEDCV